MATYKSSGSEKKSRGADEEETELPAVRIINIREESMFLWDEADRSWDEVGGQYFGGRVSGSITGRSLGPGSVGSGHE